MSKISTIYDELYTLISGAFPSKNELINPYELTDNHEQILFNGYGIAWEIGTDTEQFNKQLLAFDREFIVVSTRSYHSTDLDTSPKKTAEKSLYEDQLTIIKTLKAFSEKSNNPTSTVEDIQFIDDNGIELVFNDAQRYLSLASRFKMTYFEKLY
jgi:hypothetical protein